MPAAVVAALYGLVHAFDLVGPKSSVVVHPQPVEAAADEEEIDLPAKPEIFAPPAAAELQLTADTGVEESAKAEPAPARASRPRRAKSAPKGSRRRAPAREEDRVIEATPAEGPKVAEVAPIEEPKVAEVAPIEEPTAAEIAPLEEANVTKLPTAEDEPPAAPPPPEETAPVPLTPLFEPEPFVRQQRAVFGRKA